jgi:hypothetical protein
MIADKDERSFAWFTRDQFPCPGGRPIYILHTKPDSPNSNIAAATIATHRCTSYATASDERIYQHLAILGVKSHGSCDW